MVACLALAPSSAAAFGGSFLEQLSTVSPVSSTVPPNGDVNPYGIVNVPESVGALVRGDTLISNFNNFENLQGTGSTLVQIAPSGGPPSVFAQIEASKLPGSCPGGVGLTTALTILPGGDVVVGSLPTSDGKAKTAQAGCLIVLDSHGKVLETISGPPINGPWDMTSVSFGPISTLFVTNVLNGTVENGETVTHGGTVVRLQLLRFCHHAPVVADADVIAKEFPERTDPGALVIGPTGVGLSFDGTLYVADTQGNRIAAVPDALFRHTPVGEGGTTVTSGGNLMNPLGLTIAPNGNIITANANDGNLVETKPSGKQLDAFNTEANGIKTGAGGLFGLTIAPNRHGVLFVNDTENALDLLH
jgi:hypothetical protein